MPCFAFSVVTTGLDLGDTNQLERLYSDAFVLVPGETDGLASIAVEIEASGEQEAVRLLAEHLGASAPELHVERIDPDLVTTSEIAARLEVARETVRLWAVQQRRDDFPAPYSIISGGQKLWLWATVHAWANSMGKVPAGEPLPLAAPFVAWYNGTREEPHIGARFLAQL
jgi:hypothetical protein